MGYISALTYYLLLLQLLLSGEGYDVIRRRRGGAAVS